METKEDFSFFEKKCSSINMKNLAAPSLQECYTSWLVGYGDLPNMENQFHDQQTRKQENFGR